MQGLTEILTKPRTDPIRQQQMNKLVIIIYYNVIRRVGGVSALIMRWREVTLAGGGEHVM